MKPKESYAEDLPYWRTNQKQPDYWIEQAKEEIKRAGGLVLSSMYGDDSTGRAAFMLYFRFDRDEFKMVWPVLKSRVGNQKAARLQAATMLYHTVKARAVEVRVRGARAAFFGDLLLSSGQTAAESSGEEFLARLPALLPGKQE